MTEYQLHTQGASHGLAPAYDGLDPMRNRPLSNGTDTTMTINRYGLGREHTNMVGSPAIVGCADGEYVRHADHAALISELQAELTGLESIVVAQTVTIAELRVDHSGGANDMVGIPAPPPRDWPKIQAYIGEYVGGYEMIEEDDQGRDGCHIPTDGERALIKDAIHGLLGESDFDALYHPQPPKCSTCNGTGIIPGDTTGEVFRPTMVCIDCAQPRRLGGRQTASFRPSTHAPYATPPADGQVQQEAESWDLSHPDKTHTMTVYSREQAEHFKGVGWQDAEKVGAQITNEMVERACRVQHVGWSIWHEPQRKTAREVMRHALTSALSAASAERFRVIKAPDDAGDDYEVEPVSIRTAPQPDAAMAGDAISDMALQDPSGATWRGMRVAGWMWEKTVGPARVRHYACHWSTGPNDAERLYRESDVRALLKRVQPASGEDARDAARWRNAAAKWKVLKVEVFPGGTLTHPTAIPWDTLTHQADAATKQERQPCA